MRITCPCCGERGLEEFTYLGDANAKRPRGGGGEATDEWVAYVYLRDNPAGPHHELWYHGAGCRSWLMVTRDTRNHAISDTIRAQGCAT